jgi:uncharacterized membrane protein YadS
MKLAERVVQRLDYQVLTCSPMQTPAQGSAACGMFEMAWAIMPLVERTKFATSVRLPVILAAALAFTWPFLYQLSHISLSFSGILGG